MQPRALFNFFARAEGFTWALLISALLLRSFAGADSLVVTIAGGTHGAVFLGYGFTAALVGVNQRWPLGRSILGIALAIVPFATVPFERYVNRRDLVAGSWRTTATDDPRDNHWFDRLFRFFIGRPYLLLVTVVAVLSALFAFLLWLGPPTEWFNR